MSATLTSDNLTRDEARLRASQITDVTYDITLTFADPAHAGTFASVTTITFTSAVGGPAFVDLDAESVDAITLNGTAVDTSAFTGTRVELTGVKSGANTVTISARCAYQHTGVGMHRVLDPVDGHTYVYTHFEPFDAHKVFACFDQPDIKATVTLHAEAPSDWEVIANYPEDRQEPRGAATLRHFAPTPTISTYLVALVGGPLHHVHSEHNGVDLGIYCRRSLAEHLDQDEIFEITRQGLDFYADYFGVAYPFAKYDQLLVPEFNMGAMENPGCVTFNEAFIFRSKVTEAARANRANVILHEMAHMWFGDLVTMRWWDDLWLNESFATYMAHLTMEKATRFTSSWTDFAAAMKTWALRQDQLPSTHPIAADMPDTHSVRLNFDGITYAKGASVLRQLAAWVGAEPFRDGLRTYFRNHAWGNATLADFLDALEKASGRNLRAWSQEWLETAGVAQLRPELTVSDGAYTAFDVVQSATSAHPTLRSHRVGVGLFDVDGKGLTRRRRVELDVAGDRTAVSALIGEKPAAVVVVNDGDLTFVKVRLDDASVEALTRSDDGIDDPLTRAVCGAALWDMTRDGEMATRDYVEIVARQTHREADVTNLERTLRQALLAVDVYGDPANRAQARARLHGAAQAAFDTAEAGGDVQLVWARILVATSDSPGDLDTITGWLDKDDVGGLRIDTDMRWQIIMRRAEAGHLTAADIDAETERDPSDIGQRRAAQALASRPLAEAKADAWKTLVAPKDVPLQMLKALMAGFRQPDQEALIADYAGEYFERVPGFWATFGIDEATALTEGLFPTYSVDADIARRAGEVAADPRLPEMPRRILREAQDSTLRAVRARKTDIAAGRR